MYQHFLAIVMTAVIFVTSLFSLGALPSRQDMPAPEPGDYGQYVDPFVGTGGFIWASAMTYPGPTAPFGMVRLGPDATMAGGLYPFKMGHGGYQYDMQPYIQGFSHTRMSGTGIREGGNFRVTPRAGDFDPALNATRPLPFSHRDETATAGYYAVQLPSAACLVELTATQRVGFHRYTFNTDKDAQLIIDATSYMQGDVDRANEGKISVDAKTGEVSGEARISSGFAGRYGGLKCYFAAQFDQPIKSSETWDNDGKDTGAMLNFGNMKGKPIELKLAISYVSAENARKNLKAEAGSLDFDAARALTRASWDSWLSRVDIKTNNTEHKKMFYTALYHSMLMPTNFTDVDGRFLGFDQKIGTAKGYTYRTDLSLWDTFRTSHSLYTLIAPEIQRDSVISLVQMARDGDGAMPRWPSGGGYTGSMFGSPAHMVITESYLKGIKGIDYNEAYRYMKKSTLETGHRDSRRENDLYNEYGYIPEDLSAPNSVSMTLEHAWADHCLGLLAQGLGYEKEAEQFLAMGQNYRNTWDPKQRYFAPRNSDGSFQKVYPNMIAFYDELFGTEFSRAYCEGSAQHYRWHAPHDPQGLIGLFGSKEYFVKELEAFAKGASRNRAAFNPGPGYWQGNQHNWHALYLFNDAGRPDLTQKYVRWSLTERFAVSPNGYDGNEDGGSLSSWYVLSSMGIYPVAGTDRYWLGAPLFDEATLQLGGGKTLKITAENNSGKNIYAQSVTLNGKRLTEASITHDMIANGGTLAFVMGPQPAAGGGY